MDNLSPERILDHVTRVDYLVPGLFSIDGRQMRMRQAMRTDFETPSCEMSQLGQSANGRSMSALAPAAIRSVDQPDQPRRTGLHEIHVRARSPRRTVRHRGNPSSNVMTTGREGSAWPAVRCAIKALRSIGRVISTGEPPHLTRECLRP
jgi:hypothetical protein